MKRIFVVDDEKDIRESLEEGLKRRGYDVATARDKSEALKIIKKSPPFGLAIVDMRLSKTAKEEEGLEVVEAIRKRDFFTQIIVLTAFGSLENVRKAMNFRIFQYINKNEEGVYDILYKEVKKGLENRELFVKGFKIKRVSKEGLKERERVLLAGLKETDLIPKDKIDEALKEQKSKGGRLEDILIEKGIEEGAINWLLGRMFDVPYVYLAYNAIDFELARSFPEDLLRKYCIIPVTKIENDITLVMANPKDEEVIRKIIKKMKKCNINVFLGSVNNINEMIDKIFGRE